jgi:Flp pilus assembly secretin CpaC
MTPALLLSVLALWVCLAVPVAAQERPIETERTLAAGESRTFEPGYPVGDVTVSAPAVAEVRVQSGRRQLVIVARETGEARLSIWDQRGVKRHEVRVMVTGATASATPRDAPREPPGKGRSRPSAQTPKSTELIELDQTLFVREQLTFEAGYEVGDVALGSPDVADFKVLPGRRQLLLFGKQPGRTNMSIWDQDGTRRHEVLLTVMTREEAQAESELRELVKDFHGVQVRRVRGRLTLMGTVTNNHELDDLNRIAEASGALTLVRVGRPAPVASVAQGPTERELLERLVREFPNVRVGRLSGQLYISGSVRTDQDYEIVRRMATALGAQTIINVRPTP